MIETPYYKFKVPEDEDFFDVAHFQEMVTEIDTALHNCVTDAEGVVEDAQNAAEEVIGEKADKSKTYQMTMSAASWTGDAAPYSIELSVTGVTDTSNVDIIPQASTEEQIDAWLGLSYMLGSQAEEKVTIQSWGDKPTVDIPITVIVRGD